MMAKSIEIRPFSNGHEFDIWQSHNCDKCKKYVIVDVEIGQSTCEIAEAIAWHACGEELTKEMAVRMGYLDKDGNEVGEPCTEFEEGKPEKPAPKTPLPPPTMEQWMRKSGMPILPGFEGE